jgi:hypothetical protein
MSIPNIGPELPDDPAAADGHRRGNPALVYRDEPLTDEVQSASTRATAVSQRFGVVRYALTRRIKAEAAPEPAAGGESDESK